MSTAMSAALAKARAFNPSQPQPRVGFGAGAAGPVNTGPFPPGGPMNTGPFPPGGAGGISTMPMPMPQMPVASPDVVSAGPAPMPQGAASMPMPGPMGPPPGNTGIVPPHMRQPMGPMEATNMGDGLGGGMGRQLDPRARFMQRKPNRSTMANTLRQKVAAGGFKGFGMRVPRELNPTLPAPMAAPVS